MKKQIQTRSASTLLLTLLAFSPLTFAADVNDIVNKANLAAFYSGNDGRAETRMTIVDKQGRKQLRQFIILRKDIEEGKDQDFIVLFSRPADIKKTAFLVKKHLSRDDDRWLYLPGLDLVKRISAGDKRTSFVGSHFFYEDISGRRVDEDSHALIESNDSYYVIKNIPKDKKSVEFSEYTVWIDKTNMMPVKIEYKDDTGKIYRRIEALEIKNIQGHPTATKMKASDLRDNAYTINEMRFIQYDIGLSDDVFSERSLRNPPQKWFKRPR